MTIGSSERELVLRVFGAELAAFDDLAAIDGMLRGAELARGVLARERTRLQRHITEQRASARTLLEQGQTQGLDEAVRRVLVGGALERRVEQARAAAALATAVARLREIGEAVAVLEARHSLILGREVQDQQFEASELQRQEESALVERDALLRLQQAKRREALERNEKIRKLLGRERERATEVLELSRREREQLTTLEKARQKMAATVVAEREGFAEQIEQLPQNPGTLGARRRIDQVFAALRSARFGVRERMEGARGDVARVRGQVAEQRERLEEARQARRSNALLPSATQA